jgi:nitrate/nitrite transporter NarK
VIFAQGSWAAGMLGFVLQAVGAVFSFVGSSYVASRYLPAQKAAIFMGLTQCLGMLGAAFGAKPVQMAIDPAGSFGVTWQELWLSFAGIGFALAAVTLIAMPREQGDSPSHHDALSFSSLLRPFAVVLGNLQSWLAGIIGGLLFAPTTIGAMVWATSFLHNGQHISMADAATDASMVPIGWIIGCPLLGYISDRIGRRKPVLMGGAALMARVGNCRRLPSGSCSSPIFGAAFSGHRIRCSNDPVHDDQGSQPAGGEGYKRRRDELLGIPDHRRHVAVRLPPDDARLGRATVVA